MEKRLKHLSTDLRSQISSGTVIVCLATAVKELVENSLDAGATAVDVRLTEFGTELIEVADNGHGIEENDFEALVLKGHTSKLQEFEDLISVESFGFRGEALSALCVLSELSVHTRVANSNIGYELIYDQKGNLTRKTPLQKQPGTTVYIRNIFGSLPVRKAQLAAKSKTEFAKLLRILYGYGIIMNGVRLSCSNSSNGKTAMAMRTSGHSDMLQNINEIFGPKQKLTPLKMCIPSADILAEYNLLDGDISNVYTIEGWISGCQHGSGRSANDRQFLFINKRPCEYPKISKLINQVYREFNVKDSPFYALDIHLDRESIDINIVPNKNQVLVQNEKLLMATIKASIRETFGATPSSVPLNCLPLVQKVVNSSAVLDVKERTGGIVFDRFKFGAISSEPPHQTAGSKFVSGRKELKSSGKKRGMPSETEGFPEPQRLNKFFRLSDPSDSLDVVEASQSKVSVLAPGSPSSNDLPPTENHPSTFDQCGSQMAERIESVAGEEPSDIIFSQYFDEGSFPPEPISMTNAFGSQPFSPVGFPNDSRSDPFPSQMLSNRLANDDFHLDFINAVNGNHSPDLENVLGELPDLTDRDRDTFSEKDMTSVPFVSLNLLTRPFTIPRASGPRLSAAPPVKGSATVEIVLEDEDSGDIESAVDNTGSEFDETEWHSHVSRQETSTFDQSRPWGKGHCANNWSEAALNSDETLTAPGVPEEEGSLQRQVFGANNFRAQVSTSSPRKPSAIFKSPLPSARKKPPKSACRPSVSSVAVGKSSASPSKSRRCVGPAAVASSSPSKLPSTTEKPEQAHNMKGRPSVTVAISLDRIQEGCLKAKDSRNNNTKAASQHVFQAGITPPQNESAERELQRNIKKADFLAMQIIGQFNNGFIVTQLDQDFFLIDQHASDERFNYESLQRSFTLQTQPLIRPMPLELTAVEETILLENEAIFLKNGFTFSVDPANTTGRVSLTTAPFIHNRVLGKDDIMEMLHILGETEGVNIRPTRVLQLIASKACRKSVMIGDALNVSQMNTIVSHMAGLLEPWKCAHGRPTIRHLFNLTDVEALSRKDEEKD